MGAERKLEAAGQEWFTTAEAAEYLRTTPAALRQRIARGQLVPDRWGQRGNGNKEHLFRRETLDGPSAGKGAA